MPRSENPTLRLVVYYRAGSIMGEISPLNLDKQRTAVDAYGWFRRSEIVAEFTEVENAASENRPQLTLAIFEAHRLDANLLISDLRGLQLDIAFLSQLAEAEKARNVRVLACGFNDGEYLPLQIMLRVAKFDAHSHSESTKAGLEAARARGARLGAAGPQNIENANVVRVALSNHNRAKTYAIIAKLWPDRNFPSLRVIADALTAQGVKTPRGKKNWTAKQVSRIMGPIEGGGRIKASDAVETPRPAPERSEDRVLH